MRRRPPRYDGGGAARIFLTYPGISEGEDSKGKTPKADSLAQCPSTEDSAPVRSHGSFFS